VAAPIWLEFMHAATQDLPIRDFDIPEGIAIMHIDPRTGLRARPGRPSIMEFFRRGTGPAVFAKTRRRTVKKKKVVAKAPVYTDPILFPGLLAGRSSEDGF
jgi:penicillin-binding protein 1A